MNVNPIPEGYHAVTPYLVVEDVQQQIDFLRNAFGAAPLEQITDAAGRVMHAEVRIGDSVIMMGGANETFPPLTSAIYLYVADTDATYAQAVQAGGQSLLEPADQFYGDRNAGVRDPAGNLWWIASRVENVSPDEIARRAREMS